MRWAGIVREASKQAIRGTVPVVEPVVSAKQLAALGAESTLLVLDPVAETALSALPLAELGGASGRVLLIVGPEGGIDPAEFSLLEEAGARRVRLGGTVLRTSTAGPAALVVLLAALGRW